MLAGVAAVSAQTVELVSVEIKTALPKAAEDVAFGQFPDEGVEVEAGFLITPETGSSVVEVDEDKCKIKSVVDAASGAASKAELEFGNFPRTSKKDGGPAYHSIEFAAPGDAPSGRLKVSGTVHAKISKGTVVEKVAKLALANGSVIKVGGLSLKVGDLMAGDDKLKFSLGSGKPMSGIKEIRFFGADGQAVEGERGGSSRMSGFGSYSESWDYEVKSGSKEISMEVVFFKDTESKDIPFEITVPAGL